MSVLLKVRYRLRAHQIGEFEGIFRHEIVPLIEASELRLLGVWKSVVGDVGEFFELWEFESLRQFEELWPAFLANPELQEIFQRTGPMVEQENFSIFEPVPLKASG